MKPIKTLICAAVAGIMAIAASEATAAAGPSPFIVSATVKVIVTNYFTGADDVQIQTIITKSLSTKGVFLLISNAVASTNNTTGFRTNFPAGSYLVFDPNRNNADDLEGVFYVTNKNGFYYQLDGFGTNAEYYSFAELDSFILGFASNLNEVSSYKDNFSNGTWTEKDFDTAILYIHDNPFSYDISANPSEVYDNNYAIVISGILQINFNSTTTSRTYSTSLSGSGNGEWKGDDIVVTKGKASEKAKTPRVK